ncbi:MAG: AMP-binding protein, partial [bacterium]|nr:AMP-binding protein [bacterium]
MIPSLFMELEKLPLTTSAKIDSKALPSPDFKSGSRYEAPANPVEEALIEVWRQILNIDGIDTMGVNDNFFNLGGDSIKSIQIASRMREYDLKLEVKDLFTHQTIKQLAPHVKTIGRSSSQDTVRGIMPLTPIQQWFFRSSFTCSYHFNQSVMIYRREGFEHSMVATVFARIIQHHDALRIVYEGLPTPDPTGADTPVIQRNRGIEGELFNLEIIDLKNLTQEEIKKRIPMEATRLQAGIDLNTGPLVKLGLFKTGIGDHLLIAIHHLVVDGVSWRILLEDIRTCFKQALQGKTLVLPAKTDSFKYWSKKLKQYAAGKYGKKHYKELEYWKNVENTAIKPLPATWEIGSEKQKRKYRENVSMNRDKTETANLLKKVNWAYNTEINDILFAALALALSEWNGMGKIRINMEGHGRESIIEDVDINRTVGWFTTQYPVLLDLKQAASYKNDRRNYISYTVKSVKETLRQIPNKGINYGVLKYLTTKTRQTGNPLTDTLREDREISFNYLGQFGEDAPGLFEISPINSGDAGSPEIEQMSLIDINGMVARDSLNMSFAYNRFQFERKHIEALAALFKSGLQEIIHQTMNRKKKEVTPSDLGYSGITIEELERITHGVKRKLGQETAINAIYPLSPMQKGMLFHYSTETNSDAYFEQSLINITGRLDVQQFKKSFGILTDRYDIFRTLFVHDGLDEPLQLVLEPGKGLVRFLYEDISHIKEKNQIQAYLEALRLEDKEKSFKLSGDMPMRIALFKTGDDSYSIIWSFYHIIMDGWCLGIIFKELLHCYRHLTEGKPLPVQMQPVTPYRKYIRWLAEQDSEDGLEFWQNYLEGYEQTATLPKTKNPDGTHELTAEYKHADLDWGIEALLTAGLNKIAQQNGTTLNLVLQSLWGLLLMKYNNNEDVVFGAVVSGRPAGIEGIEDMIGLFINTVPVRVTAGDRQEFRQLLSRQHSGNAKTNEYEYLSLADVQSQSPLKGRLFDHIMVFENFPVAEELKQSTREQGLPFNINTMEAREQTNYSFNIILAPGKCIKITFSYNAFVYERAVVENIRHHLSEIIRQVVENPRVSLKNIQIVTEKEKAKILYEFNDTAAHYPRNKTIHRIFEEQVEKTPDSVAITGVWPKPVDETQLDSHLEPSLQGQSSPRRFIQLTYRELNERAGHLTCLLQEKGFYPGAIAGLAVPPSVKTVIAIIAVWKAEGSYLPMELTFPMERIKYMLADSNARILLCENQETRSMEREKMMRELSENIEVIQLKKELLRRRPQTHSQPTPFRHITNTKQSHNIAYIIYTSGTTGKPKGVMVPHSSFVNRLYWLQNRYGFDSSDVFIQKTPITFDVSVCELFRWIPGGGRVVIMKPGGERDLEAMLSTIAKHNATTIDFVPSMLNLFLDFIDNNNAKAGVSTLRWVFVGVEPLRTELVKKFNRRIYKRYETRLINAYGPTEATVDITGFDCSAPEGSPVDSFASVPIGRPIQNTQIFILDKHSNIQPVRVPGELCIAGKSLALGYLNNPELTAERFANYKIQATN